MSDDRPHALDGLEVHEVEDGLVVYDAERDRVHYLNATASAVLTLCDGTRSVDEVAALVQSAWELPDAPADAVIACVAQLRTEGLLA